MSLTSLSDELYRCVLNRLDSDEEGLWGVDEKTRLYGEPLLEKYLNYNPLIFREEYLHTTPRERGKFIALELDFARKRERQFKGVQIYTDIALRIAKEYADFYDRTTELFATALFQFLDDPNFQWSWADGLLLLETPNADVFFRTPEENKINVRFVEASEQSVHSHMFTLEGQGKLFTDKEQAIDELARFLMKESRATTDENKTKYHKILYSLSLDSSLFTRERGFMVDIQPMGLDYSQAGDVEADLDELRRLSKSYEQSPHDRFTIDFVFAVDKKKKVRDINKRIEDKHPRKFLFQENEEDIAFWIR